MDERKKFNTQFSRSIPDGFFFSFFDDRMKSKRGRSMEDLVLPSFLSFFKEGKKPILSKTF